MQGSAFARLSFDLIESLSLKGELAAELIKVIPHGTCFTEDLHYWGGKCCVIRFNFWATAWVAR